MEETAGRGERVKSRAKGPSCKKEGSGWGGNGTTRLRAE